MTAAMYDVCVITTIHPPYDGRIYERGVRAYTHAGLRTAFVGPWPYAPDSGVESAGWSTTPTSRRRTDRLLTGWRAYQAALRLPSRVYHFHDLDFLPWAVRLKHRTGASVIYDVHELYPEDILYHKDWIPPAIRPAASAAVRRLENWAVRALGETIVVVPYLQERFQKIGARSVLIRNFTRTESYPELEHARALMFAGTVQEALGADVLLEIAEVLGRRAPDVPLIVPDRFHSDPLRRRFLRASERLPLRIVPQVRAAELGTLMRQGAIGLVTDPPTPSMAHGMHAKFFDYLAFGLPLVASDIANARGLVEATGCGVVVPPGDAEAFVTASLDILNDDAKREEYRQNGFRAFRERFSWTSERARLIDYVRSLVSNSSS